MQNSLFIDPNTLNVGIGTTRPLSKLHVEGNITASNMSILGDFVTLNTITSNTEQMVISNAGTGPALKVTQSGAQPIADFYDDNNVLAMRIADGGNVGIGGLNPMAKLHILATNSTQLRIESINQDTSIALYKSGVKQSLWGYSNTAGYSYFQNTSNDFMRVYDNNSTVEIYNTNSAGTLLLNNQSTGRAEFLRLKDRGGSILEIYDANGANTLGGANILGFRRDVYSAIRLVSYNQNSTNTNEATMLFKSYCVTDATSGSINSQNDGLSTSYQQSMSENVRAFDFITNFNSTSATQMTITHFGNVGIGITNPTAKLEVNSRYETFKYILMRNISDRGVCNGTYGGYLLLIPAYVSGNVEGKKFYGEIIADRGGINSGNSNTVAKIHVSTAYQSGTFKCQIFNESQYFSNTNRVKFNNIFYYALRFESTGGNPGNGVFATGYYYGVDNNFLYMAVDSEVSEVTTYGTRIVAF